MEKGSRGQPSLVRGEGGGGAKWTERETETSAEGHIVRRRGHTGLVGIISCVKMNFTTHFEIIKEV